MLKLLLYQWGKQIISTMLRNKCVGLYTAEMLTVSVSSTWNLQIISNFFSPYITIWYVTIIVSKTGISATDTVNTSYRAMLRNYFTAVCFHEQQRRVWFLVFKIYFLTNQLFNILFSSKLFLNTVNRLNKNNWSSEA